MGSYDDGNRSDSPAEDDDSVHRILDHSRIFDCNDDDIAMRVGAERSRLLFDQVSHHEMMAFPELWSSRSAIQVYLFIRNTALRQWLADPLNEFGLADLRSEIPPPFNSDPNLIARIHAYLQRHGLINFGRYVRTTAPPVLPQEEKKKVIVIGAGAAGLSAATQLISFGFDVTIVEGRNRIGGRVSTINADNDIMETGAETIYSFRSNPLSVLVQQLNVEPIVVNQSFTLYDNGKQVDDTSDRIIEKCYWELRGTVDHLSHNKAVKGKRMSRLEVFEVLLSQMQHQTLKNLEKYWTVYNELLQSRVNIYKEYEVYEKIVRNLEAELARTAPPDSDVSKADVRDATQRTDDVMRRCIRRDYSLALQRLEKEAAQVENIEITLQNYKKQTPGNHYMLAHHYRHLNFYLAHEEYAYGAPLHKVQVGCSDMRQKSSGLSIRLRDSLSSLFTKLIQERGMDINLCRKVTDISYDSNGVVVTTKKTDAVEGEEDVEKFEADFCVCTLPLGVLKKSVKSDVTSGAPNFTPPIPEKLASVISRMGYGLVNKLLMTFERSFWDSNGKFFFGNISPVLESRGEFFLFSSIPESRVLTGYFVGSSAHLSVPQDTLVRKAMAILTGIFGGAVPKAPLSVHVTRWQDDEFSFGAFSYYGLQSNKEDYDELKAPLKAKTYTGSLQGAWISGARAAATIANKVFGCPYADIGDDDMFDDDYEMYRRRQSPPNFDEERMAGEHEEMPQLTRQDR
ncbi:unnamed protein product [Caenorhabditis auriculariae]|uniref:Lysine-specific histone demethylase n=1 Tax=Caenorhabditis auriculariae TaxID=2777116 RepID=A0A8S1GTZ0_9PELO|nr:unnamed protein product [Caenorhabditis auriculariae]